MTHINCCVCVCVSVYKTSDNDDVIAKHRLHRLRHRDYVTIIGYARTR